MSNEESHELQLIYTQIDRNAKGHVQFIDYNYKQDDQHYFYPASTVKLPTALLALEYIQQEPYIHIDTPYIIANDTITHTIADDIRQIFAVSDNEAYNRLYEFMGRDYINTRLREKGLPAARIAHRLSTPNANDSLRSSILFRWEGETPEETLFKGQFDQSITPLELEYLQKGNGYQYDGNLVNAPFDFSQKNYFPLQTQHELMKRLFFPETFLKEQQFDLTDADRHCLLQAMSTPPRKQGYDETTYYDSYVKFFLYGDTQDRIPDHIKIYNKVGYAYGTLTETAYIIDEKMGVEFLLSATILVNKNGVFNDDTYEYDTVGIPFLAQLGREVYKVELQRK